MCLVKVVHGWICWIKNLQIYSFSLFPEYAPEIKGPPILSIEGKQPDMLIDSTADVKL